MTTVCMAYTMRRNGNGRFEPAKRRELSTGSVPSPWQLDLSVSPMSPALWSPQQISGWLRVEFADRAEMQASHETIYMSLFVQTLVRFAESSLTSCAAAG